MTQSFRTAVVSLLVAVAACSSGSDGADTSTPQSEAAPNSDEVVVETLPSEPEETSVAQAEAPRDGNASIGFGGETFVFESDNCDLLDPADESVTGVIAFQGVPTFVKIRAFGGDGLAILNVGVAEEPMLGAQTEADLERGLVEIWNLTYETDDVTTFTDTEIAGSGTFVKILSLDGTTGEEVAGSFAADCS